MQITPESGRIPVVTACNNNFAILAAAFLKSLEVNSLNPETYIIYILADKVSARNKRRLLKSTNLTIRFLDITAEVTDRIDLPDKIGYLPKTAYFRLMIPELFSKFEKVIYLDIDVLVLKDLTNLWNVDMEDKLCLACECFYASDHRGRHNFRKMSLDEDSPYFNSGVLVIDVQKWRKYQVRERVNDVLNNDLRDDPKAMDEEGLNVVLHNKWKPLDKRWNYPPHIVERNNMPFLVHFIGYKPIYYDYKTGLQDVFFDYLKGTSWEHKKKFGFFRKAYIKAPFLLNVQLNRMMTLLSSFSSLPTTRQ